MSFPATELYHHRSSFRPSSQTAAKSANGPGRILHTQSPSRIKLQLRLNCQRLSEVSIEIDQNDEEETKSGEKETEEDDDISEEVEDGIGVRLFGFQKMNNFITN